MDDFRLCSRKGLIGLALRFCSGVTYVDYFRVSLRSALLYYIRMTRFLKCKF
jgi:hypothetical protein